MTPFCSKEKQDPIVRVLVHEGKGNPWWVLVCSFSIPFCSILGDRTVIVYETSSRRLTFGLCLSDRLRGITVTFSWITPTSFLHIKESLIFESSGV